MTYITYTEDDYTYYCETCATAHNAQEITSEEMQTFAWYSETDATCEDCDTLLMAA